MSITDVSILHHVAIVLVLLWVLAALNWCYPIWYMLSLVYLYLVHEGYTVRLRKKIQFEERKQANQKRVLSDSETVRWLNHAMEKIWPICMEQIVSQQVLLPIVPWFLEKYKPWTAKEAVVQHMYMGRTPPMFTDMRVLKQNTDDDHLVMELGMNFFSADDMSGILAVKLRRRLGFGMWAKLNITGMHVEGKVLVGVKFLPKWPFLGRLRICFVQPPYFQMTVKPVFTHGLDVTELPGIAGWLDKLLSIAFEETLVAPNMLVVDMEKFVSPLAETWFSVDEKEPVAHVKVEVIEASNLKPADLNGLADPYVKGQLGPYRFRTKTQKKTLTPKWQEEFKIPICTWDSPNILAIDVSDKDYIVDDALGECSINIGDFRDNQRHDMWLPLQNVKMGRLHLAVTVVETIGKGGDHPPDEETLHKEDKRDSFASETTRKGSFSSAASGKYKEDKRDSFASETTRKGSFSSAASGKSPKEADEFEPINIEGQDQTGIWVQHPGSEVSQTWEPRKGKGRRLDTKVRDSFGRHVPEYSAPYSNDSSSTDENGDGIKKPNRVRRGLNKIGSMFHRSPKKDDFSGNIDALLSPRANVKAADKEVGVHLIVEDNILKVSGLNPEESGLPDSPRNGNAKEVAKTILNKAGKTARSFKHGVSRQGSKRHDADPDLVLRNTRYDSSDDESLSSPKHPPSIDPIPGVTVDPTITIINSADRQ